MDNAKERVNWTIDTDVIERVKQAALQMTVTLNIDVSPSAAVNKILKEWLDQNQVKPADGKK